MSRRAPPDAGAAHTATVDFTYADERRARVVADSVAVEVDEIADDRSRADVRRDGRVLSVDVAAADLIALRAGLNTWIRLVEVAEGVAADAEAEDGDDADVGRADRTTDETGGEGSQPP